MSKFKEEDIQKIIQVLTEAGLMKNYTIITPEDTEKEVERKLKDLKRQAESKETLN